MLEELAMKVVIRLSAKQEARALPILLRHSPGMVLGDRTYIIDEDAVQQLQQADIRFTEIGRELNKPVAEGTPSGERI